MTRTVVTLLVISLGVLTSGTTTTLWSDSTYSLAQWTTCCATVSTSTSDPCTGNCFYWSAGGYLYRTNAQSTLGYVGIALEFDLLNAINNAMEGSDACFVQYSVDNSYSWTTLASYGASQLPTGLISISLPENASNNIGVRIRFGLTGTASVDFCMLQTAKLKGTPGTTNPTKAPTTLWTYAPTPGPTLRPSSNPSPLPTTSPSAEPSKHPSLVPSAIPTSAPTVVPTVNPSTIPTNHPTGYPSSASPSKYPSEYPSTHPSFVPSNQPTMLPTTGNGGGGRALSAHSNSNVLMYISASWMSYVILALLIILFLILIFTAQKHSAKYEYQLNTKNVCWFIYHVFDFVTDLLFIAFLFSNDNGHISIWSTFALLFIIAPSIVSVFQMRRNIKIWRNDSTVVTHHQRVWFDKYSVFLNITSFLFGSNQPCIDLCTCNAFHLNIFELQLEKYHFLKLHVSHCFSSVLLRNIPQVIIQLVFVTSKHTLNEVIVLAIGFSVVSILLSPFMCCSKRNLFLRNEMIQQNNVTMFGFDPKATTLNYVLLD